MRFPDCTAHGKLEPSGRIAGFDAFREKQPIDYGREVSGLEVLDRYRFRIHLTKPFPQLLNVLGTCYASVVAREVVEKYGQEIGAHPVGTGPFRVKADLPGTKIVLERHEKYRAPVIDGVVFHIFEQDQPMWLKWRVGDLDYIQVPADYFDAVFDEQSRFAGQPRLSISI